MGDRTGANDCLELLEHPELARYVHDTGNRLHASAVVIFGSRARGEHLEVSDYDLAVVSPDFRGLNRLRRRDKLYEVWDEVGPDADADIFGLTHEELLAMEAPMLWDILEEGKPLLDDGTWRAALAQFEQRKATGYIIAVEGGWRIGEGPD